MKPEASFFKNRHGELNSNIAKYPYGNIGTTASFIYKEL